MFPEMYTKRSQSQTEPKKEPFPHELLKPLSFNHPNREPFSYNPNGPKQSIEWDNWTYIAWAISKHQSIGRRHGGSRSGTLDEASQKSMTDASPTSVKATIIIVIIISVGGFTPRT